MGASKSSTYFTHSLPPLPSYQFLCSTWNPVSSPRPTRVGGRRAQGLSRSAVALAWRHAPSFPGRALTAPSTAARLLWSGLHVRGELAVGARGTRAATLYPVGRSDPNHDARMRIGGEAPRRWTHS